MKGNEMKKLIAILIPVGFMVYIGIRLLLSLSASFGGL
jgi:hypothetical protein